MQTRSIALIAVGILIASFLFGVAYFYFGYIVDPSSYPTTILGHIAGFTLTGLKGVGAATLPTIILCTIIYLVSKHRVDLDPVAWGATSGVVVSLMAWIYFAIITSGNIGVSAEKVISNGLLALLFGGLGGFFGGRAAPES